MYCDKCSGHAGGNLITLSRSPQGGTVKAPRCIQCTTPAEQALSNHLDAYTAPGSNPDNTVRVGNSHYTSGKNT